MACGGRDEGRTKDTVDRITAAGGTAVAVRGRRVPAGGRARRSSRPRRRRWAASTPSSTTPASTRPSGRTSHDWPVEEFDELIRTNLRGPFLVAKYSIPHLLEAGGGAIVHMSSVCAITVWAGDCGYDISKAGLNMLSDHIAVEYGPQGIRSNTLMPGVIATELHESVMVAMDDGARVRARAAIAAPDRPVRGRRGGRGRVRVPVRGRGRFPDGREHLHRRRLQPGLTPVRITDIRTHVLLDPGYDAGATSSAQDTIVVEVDTDEGLDRDRRDRSERLDRARVHRGAGDAHDGPRAARSC